MCHDGPGSLRACLPATTQHRSDPDHSSAWIGGRPSSHLNNEEWRSIADSLGLSVRQLQIVRYVFDGLDEPSIANTLGISSHTVHAHLNRLYTKIRVTSRCELIVRVFLAYRSLVSAGRA